MRSEFIASGEVFLKQNGKKHILQHGDFFGDATLDETDSEEIIFAKAISSCDLLILDRYDFVRLLAEDKNLRIQINQAINERKEI